jgi:hypothetical protein
VPAEAGPVAEDSSAFTFSAPPPRQQPGTPPAPILPPAAAPPAPSSPEPVIGSGGNPPDLDTGSGGAPTGDQAAPAPERQEELGATARWEPGQDATTALPGQATWSPGLDATTVAAAPAGQAAAVAPAAPSVEPDRPAWNPGASAGVIGTPGAAVLDERGNLPGGLVGLLAAVLVTVGVFLPWIDVEGRDVSGWAASGDAKVLLLVAAAATVVAALVIAGARSLGLKLGLIGLGVVTAVLGVYEILSASGIDDFAVTLGLGLPLVIVGGVALGAAGVLTRHKRFR